MSEHYNEEIAWRRLQDMQREIENHRLVAGGGSASVTWWLPLLARRVWLVAGLAGRRAPRWRLTAGAPPSSRRIAS
ncbi:MAG TPA: hypothetical protein VFL29_07715 [Candidatus Dormibacteraeota bacterium]|nr:hypothetical protein [Candidatus Dormibacteraeota bacterium]